MDHLSAEASKAASHFRMSGTFLRLEAYAAILLSVRGKGNNGMTGGLRQVVFLSLSLSPKPKTLTIADILQQYISVA